ncbi:MAG: rhomboid family intramembrane serine protease [Pseudomonadota bacterium]
MGRDCPSGKNGQAVTWRKRPIVALIGAGHIRAMTEPTAPLPQSSFWRTNSLTIMTLTAIISAVTFYQWSADERTVDWLFRAFAVIGGREFEDIPKPYGEAAPYVLHVLLHGGVAHLGMNMLALYALGTQLIKMFGPSARGKVAFLAFFAFCAVGGAVAQLLVWQVTGESGIAIGASSAISGLLPALGYAFGGWRGALRNSAVWIAINIGLAVFGAAFPIPIAWAAHIGGVAAGFAIPIFLRFAWR